MKLSGVIIFDKSYVHTKGQGQMFKVAEVKTNFAPIWVCQDHQSSSSSKMAMKWWNIDGRMKGTVYNQGDLSNFRVAGAEKSPR